ncbi:MAG TPA: hypothetical protein VGK74_19785 [Symbiobacteriaceae bacterium]|jgi:hypothetical protein
MAFLLCAGTLGLLESQPGRAAAESLQVTTVAERVAADQVELRVSWHWDPPAPDRGWTAREHLLAVSFDTHALVFEKEEAPAGRGADGEELGRLDRFAGADGSRRLFVVPEGQDGFVRIRFRPVYPGLNASADPFRVYVVFRSPSEDIWMKETTVSAPVSRDMRPSQGLPH